MTDYCYECGKGKRFKGMLCTHNKRLLLPLTMPPSLSSSSPPLNTTPSGRWKGSVVYPCALQWVRSLKFGAPHDTIKAVCEEGLSQLQTTLAMDFRRQTQLGRNFVCRFFWLWLNWTAEDPFLYGQYHAPGPKWTQMNVIHYRNLWRWIYRAIFKPISIRAC